MAGRRRPALTTAAEASPRLYTAQDVARFCEVDLKTIHHWADAQKIPHHRTEGRHLRFRRNHIVQFLRTHGYPLPDELATGRPLIHYAARDEHDDEVVKKLAPHFAVRRFADAIVAIANLVAGEPDALVVASDDETFGGARAITALRANPETAWPAIVVVARGDGADETRTAGADRVVAAAELVRLGAELSDLLGVD